MEKVLDAEGRCALVERVLAGVVGAEAAGSLRSNGDLLRSGALDSFTVIELAAALEVACSLTIPPHEINETSFASIQSIADLLGRLGNTR